MNPDKVLRDLLARALPYIPTPVMVDAVTTFLVTGTWTRPIEPERYWVDILNSRIDTAMSWYCSYRFRTCEALSVKSQIHALDSFYSSIIELEHCIQNHENP